MSDTNAWVAGFRSAIVSPYEEFRLAEPREFADQTVRQVLHLAGGGERLRVRLSNRYGRAPLVVGAAHIAVRKNGAEIVAETDTALRFGGAERVTIAAGAEIVSDAADLSVGAGSDLLLSLYLPEPTGPATYSPVPNEIGYVTAGNTVSQVSPEDVEELGSRYFVTGIDVPATGEPIIVAFGDSWFEGAGGTPGANRRSVDVLNERLPRGWAVNQGLSGNRILVDEAGEHGLARFERDALAVPGATHVVVNFGINDLCLGEPLPVADLIAGFTELARRAHAAGLPVYANTIGPFAGKIYPGGDAVAASPLRREVNEWLRGTDVFDAVFDVARAVEDPERPDYIRPDLDAGDGMHLNDAGARLMGETMRIPFA
ncbi:lysophospholipase L1-like esterase [Nocardia sp. GAS34]|jgi:lysophospholipase L1-like esterase|uniref:GDSL-type esterase/lipase family protein n=1 Tax=unclassified Nocardia TaxID=2637762 RepID=UPI003D1D06D1